jgi:hypothetical protein
MPVERVTTAQLTALPGGYGEGFAPQPYYAALLERVDALPGVASAALSYNALLAPVAAARVGVAGSDVEVQAEQALVSDAFFTTLQIPLVAGTGFPAQARSGAARGVIVSASLAADLFGNADAVGRAVRLGASPQTQAMPVLGVARDAVLSSPQERNTRVVYLSFWQAGHAFQMYPTLVVRTDGEAAPAAPDLQAAVRAGGREYVSETRTLAGQRDASLVQERLLALVSTAFAAVGLAIAAIGLYGLLGFTVAQRTSEIGVRMALGAGRRRIAAAVVGGAWRLIAAGVAFGAPAAWAASRAAAEAVYGQASTGLVPTAMAVALMFGIGTAAAWRPVRRALRVDPASGPAGR